MSILPLCPAHGYGTMLVKMAMAILATRAFAAVAMDSQKKTLSKNLMLC